MKRFVKWSKTDVLVGIGVSLFAGVLAMLYQASLSPEEIARGKEEAATSLQMWPTVVLYSIGGGIAITVLILVIGIMASAPCFHRRGK